MAAEEIKDHNWLRRQFVLAIASEPELGEFLVLKGGNALAMFHRIGERASLDLDYSMETDLEDAAAFAELLKHALHKRLADRGFLLLDWEFHARPAKPDLQSDFDGVVISRASR